jgi:integration host factor subunit alpha
MPIVAKTVTRVELSDAVYRAMVGLTRTKSAELVDLVLKEITDTIARGETVKLSSFGTFTVRKKGQRMGRNPKTGVEAPIAPRRVAVFKASAIMKRKIQNNSKSDARNHTTGPNFRSIATEPLHSRLGVKNAGQRGTT